MAAGSVLEQLETQGSRFVGNFELCFICHPEDVDGSSPCCGFGELWGWAAPPSSTTWTGIPQEPRRCPGAVGLYWKPVVLETSWDSEPLLHRGKSCPEAKPALRSCVDSVWVEP